MKKLLSTIICLVMAMSCIGFASCKKKTEYDKTIKVAMITDYGDITDQSFNQTTYEACKSFCKSGNYQFKYYRPGDNSTAGRVASTKQAIQDGYDVIVMPGYAFAHTIRAVAGENPNVQFVALDVSEADLTTTEDYQHIDYTVPSNVACFVYQEELAGYMAGYAAVKEGYKKLGFLGGMAVPAVIRFGYGYVQGANAAAVEMNIVNEVSMNYVYGGQFFGDSDITAVMDTWYSNGTEVVFACGGGIYSSACEAATKKGVNGKVIGVDTDQHGVITKEYKDSGLCITSAMKGLAATVKTVLTDIVSDRKEETTNWTTKYSAKVKTLGLVSATDMEANYVQLPLATWSMTHFTKDDYKDLVAKMYNGTITVSNATDVKPTVDILVSYQEQIK